MPGGCTRDLVHRFYQEQYQIDGGKQDRYVTGSDAVGLTMGRYATTSLPIYRYLHSKGAPNYVVADRFFQGAFGGSFLNHQYLIAARAPVDTGGATPTAANSMIDSNGMPTSYPLYTATSPVRDAQLTRACSNGAPFDYTAACGNIAVNTVQPSSAPSGGGAKIPLIDDAVYPNIGDRMSDAGVSWNWYSGGWDDAAAGHPGPLFQYHHQPFNYFKNYAVGAPGRSHLQDETKFIAAARAGTLPQVSFVKPYGAENEHPGYASEPDGSDHLVDLLQTITSGPQAEHDARRRDVRRVRRPVGPRLAARRRRVGAGHPHPRARPVGRHGEVRGRQHDLRHDLHHGDDRAQLRAAPRRPPGRRSHRPQRRGAGRRPSPPRIGPSLNAPHGSDPH